MSKYDTKRRPGTEIASCVIAPHMDLLWYVQVNNGLSYYNDESLGKIIYT